MAIAFGTSGAAAGSTSSTLTVSTPASVAANDLLILAICNKYPTNGPATPSGWTLVSGAQASGGKGSSGNASGNVYGTVFTKVSNGAEPGSVAVTITSNNDAVGRMFRYTCGAGKSWGLSATSGTYAGGNFEHWSATTASNPGIVANDVVVAVSASNGPRTYASEAITCTGCTFSAAVERGDDWDLNGDNVSMAVSEHAATAGPSSSTATFTMEGSGSGTNDPAGVTVLLLLHELSNQTETMDVGTFALTGQDVGAGTSQTADVGTFALTGQDVTESASSPTSATGQPVQGDNLRSVNPLQKEVYGWGGQIRRGLFG